MTQVPDYYPPLFTAREVAEPLGHRPTFGHVVAHRLLAVIRVERHCRCYPAAFSRCLGANGIADRGIGGSDGSRDA
jgi:hypothetical protein